MAITFAKPKKKKETYSLIILVILLIVFIVVLLNVFKEHPALISVKPGEIQPVQINFSNLKNPILKELDPFEELEEFKGDIGRENPFLGLSPSAATPPTK
jgi:flagellar basal body-associated protein FliL